MAVIGRTEGAEGTGDQAQCTEPRKVVLKLNPWYWKYRLLLAEGNFEIM